MQNAKCEMRKQERRPNPGVLYALLHSSFRTCPAKSRLRPERLGEGTHWEGQRSFQPLDKPVEGFRILGEGKTRVWEG